MIEKKGKMLSVVLSVYNEEENIEELHQRLIAALTKYTQQQQQCCQFEIIYVDDGSEDNSLDLLKSKAEKQKNVRVVELLRNFGQHMAILAGMEHAQGDMIVTIDADLQNPPEEIPKLVEKMLEGYDVVGGWRKDREDRFWRRLFSRLMNKIISVATGIPMKDYGCMLRAYSKEVVRAMCSSHETVTYVPALANSFAKKITEVEVKHSARLGGESKYNFLKLLRLYFDLLTGFSLIPIQLVGLLGALVALTGSGFGFFLLLRRLLIGPEAEGVFTLFAISFVFLGLEILALALIGEYIGRIYMNVKGRPPYLVRHIYKQPDE